jgi:hypothetical protein
MNEETNIPKSREEVLGGCAKTAAEQLSQWSLGNLASETVNTIPVTEIAITRRDSNSETEKWKRGCADWQRPHW